MDDADKKVENPEVENPETKNAESEKEIKEVDAVESEKAEESEKRESFFQEVKNGFKSFWEKSKKFVKDTAHTVNEYFSAQQEINALDKLFEEEAEKFTDVKTGRTRYAILSDDGGSLLLRREGDGVLLYANDDDIKPGAHLSSKGKMYEILEVNKDASVPFQKQGNTQKLECYIIKVEEKK